MCVTASAGAALFVVAFIGGARTGDALDVIGVVPLLAIATVFAIYGRNGSVHGHSNS